MSNDFEDAASGAAALGCGMLILILQLAVPVAALIFIARSCS